MKRILLIFSMLACLCLLAACGSSEKGGTSDPAAEEAQYKSYAEQLLNQIVALDDATMDSYISGGQLPEGLVAGLKSWKEAREELGDFESVTDTEVSVNDEEISVVVNAKFSKREGTYSLTMDKEGNVIGASFDKVYTMGEIFEKAVLNTLMGMGTVFAVLIFIAFIISLFKYIPDVQAKFAGKKEEVAAPATEALPEATEPAAEEEDLVDNGELAAVIMAAVYAAMSESGKAVSKDGLVVRSIRRARK